MYPSIPEELGLEQCRKKLDTRKEALFSTAAIIDALKITLHHNLTLFNGILFLQMLGTAIGPKNACDYADVAISMIDDLVFRIIAEGDPPIIPILWARFRDDVYLPWIGTLEELDMFVKWVNNIHPSIQFTYSTPSTTGTEYLNMFVYTDENGLIQTKSHSKPCDTHAFLVPTSCHPTHQIENIPYSIANKVYSVCSTDHDYNVAKRF